MIWAWLYGVYIMMVVAWFSDGNLPRKADSVWEDLLMITLFPVALPALLLFLLISSLLNHK